MQDQELNSLYKRLQEEIVNGNTDKIQQLADKIIHITPQDKDIQYLKALSFIRGDQPEQASQFFQTKPSNKDKQMLFSYIYYLYKTGKYDLALQTLEKEADQKDKQIQLLKAQILYVSKKYSDSTDVYMKLLKQGGKKDEQFDDILANCLCVQSHKEFLGVESSKELEQLEQLLGGDSARECLFNYGVLLSLVGKQQKSLEILEKFEGLVKKQAQISDQDQEDLIMSQVQKDFANFSINSFSSEVIEEKLEYYEKLNEQNLRDLNLKAVINNNIVSFRGLYKHQQYGDSVKLIEEAISKNMKQTEEQLFNFKLNKLLLVLNKNKLVECQNVLNDLEKNYSKQNLIKSLKYITVKCYLLMKMEKNDELEEFQKLIKQQSQQMNDKKFTLSVFLIQSEICRLKNQSQQIIDLFTELSNQDSSVYENNIICSFIFSILQSDHKLLEKAGPILKEIASNTQNLQILEILGDIYYKEKEIDVARTIFEKILTKDPSSKKYRLKIAQFYSREDPQRAEQLLSQLEDDIELLSQEEVEKLESELALSKLNASNQLQQNKQQQQQVDEPEKKKKKRKIRYPKNFDPENPGPLPNPERWLPKYERKEFRKKKGLTGKKNATQGSSSAQNNKDTKGTFQTAHSTANQDVSTENSKVKGRGKKK